MVRQRGRRLRGTVGHDMYYITTLQARRVYLSTLRLWDE